MRVKICGVCRADDAMLALAAGADYVGVIVVGPGPRAQGVAGASAVFAGVPAAARAGVFVDAPVAEVIAAARTLALGVVQLHGAESPAQAAALRAAVAAGGASVWKVVHARTSADLEAAVAAYGGAVDGLLLDSVAEGRAGGTGRRFDWAAVAPARTTAAGLMLGVAGGLAEENVAEAVALFRPDVIDVSSGVEATVGCKSPARVRGFVARARAAAGP